MYTVIDTVGGRVDQLTRHLEPARKAVVNKMLHVRDHQAERQAKSEKIGRNDP